MKRVLLVNSLVSRTVYLPDIVGRGYKQFWEFRGRYRVVKGSRASKKSRTAALWFIWHIMKYPEANLLVVRKVFRTLKDSCFAVLKWAILRLGVSRAWEVKEVPLEMAYLPTGQKIYFRGLDDSQKISSLTVEVGALNFMWIEEAYEIMHEDDFSMLDECIRGECAEPLFKQITLTFNPWNQHHWLKTRFFDKTDNNILALTTNYECNEWLDSADKQMFEAMKANNPRRYRVAGLGEWGIVEGVIFTNWSDERFSVDEVRRVPGIRPAFGLDFGYTNDPTALFCGLVDRKTKTIWVFDELYKKGLSNEAIFSEVNAMGYARERIRADSAEPKTIDRLRELGMRGVRPARKGRDSVKHGIDFIQDFQIVVHPKCVNFITEISNYTWDEDRAGRKLNRPIDDFNHLMDAMRYALEGVGRGETYSFE